MAIPTRVLGKTGAEVTALGLGGVCWNLVDDDAAAARIVHRAIDLGITYIDTASGYKESERRLGLALRERERQGLFIATKCIKRRGDEVKREIAESFQRLQIETIDLMQLHAIDQEQNPDQIFESDGAVRVIEEYQKAGKIRFIGMSGHTNPQAFVDLMGKYEFDTVLNALGAVNRVWNDFSQVTIPPAREQGMGVIAMKVMAYGQVPEGLRGRFIRYAMGLDVDVAIVGMDTIAQVEENVAVADGFRALSPEEEREVLDRALEIARGDKKTLWFLPEQRKVG
ncbi:MAG: aldo/keto reductase [Gemmatimonadota bacterium]